MFFSEFELKRIMLVNRDSGFLEISKLHYIEEEKKLIKIKRLLS
jgi:hypothetical protein